jgi:histidinol-phosphatase
VNSDLALALSLADDADAITMRYFNTSVAVRTKADRTPVSEADESVERKIRERLSAERPDDAIVGEEFGTSGHAFSENAAPRRWIIDPIDATKNYIRGVPVFATLIALEGRVGVVSAPALQRRWYAARGEGAFCNGRPIAVSAVGSLREAHLGYDSITDFDEHGLGERFLALARSCARTRGFGDFWAHMLVAEGAMDAAVEPRVALWDMAPVQVIVEEAGGRFSTLGGAADPAGGSGVSSNGRIHEAVLEALR